MSQPTLGLPHYRFRFVSRNQAELEVRASRWYERSKCEKQARIRALKACEKTGARPVYLTLVSTELRVSTRPESFTLVAPPSTDWTLWDGSMDLGYYRSRRSAYLAAEKVNRHTGRTLIVAPRHVEAGPG